MPKGSTYAQDIQKLVFLNQDIAGIGDAGGLRGSVAAGSLYATLHTADPSSGDQSTSEVTYTGFGGRVAIARGAGFSRAGNVITLAADVLFAKCTGGSLQTATHFSIGSAASGGGKIIHSGPLSPNIAIQNGVIPVLESGTSVTET